MDEPGPSREIGDHSALDSKPAKKGKLQKRPAKRPSRDLSLHRDPVSHQRQRFNQQRSQSSLPHLPHDHKYHNRPFNRGHSRDGWSSKRLYNTWSLARSLSPPRKVFKGSSNNRSTRKPDPDYRNFQNPPNQMRHNTKERFMGFKLLEELTKCDNEDILVKINQRKDAFFNLVKSHIEKPDIFVLVTELMAKVSLSSFSQLKMEILQEICSSAYLGNFQKYLMDIPYMPASEMTMNNLYWQNQEVFWVNFVTFCECLMTYLPVTASQKCRSMIEDSSKLCLEKLAERHDFKLSNECILRLTQLRERLVSYEKEMIEKSQKKQQAGPNDCEPPQGFRELNIIPDAEELLGRQPFLRPNVIDGGYNNKEHYLDVQYRLLREDCFGPLREGIRQYMADPNKWKYDHIRVYNNVKFLGPYIPKTRDNIGSMVQMDIKSRKWPKRINWASSKRFLFGSLLLFTRDKCNSFIVATLLERDAHLITQGQFAVTIVNTTPNDEDIYDDKPYVMIESEVYFEPYFQVLNALRAPDFPDHFAMEKYIVNVKAETTPPAYLTADKKFEIQTKTSKLTFKVLDDEEWPNKNDLGFDESQYEAYKLALKHEFAVIQGPPGTGKTFIGVKVATTLLENDRNVKNVNNNENLAEDADRRLWRFNDMDRKVFLSSMFNVLHHRHRCLMLVICYTNHALDQFLEALLPITNSIVRIGGRSQNEAMEKINLKTIRQSTDGRNFKSSMMREKKRELRQAVFELQNAMHCLDIIDNGVLTFDSVNNFIPEEVTFLGKYYESTSNAAVDDPLKQWLFQHCLTYMDSQPIDWDTVRNPNINTSTVEEDSNKRSKPVLDDIDDEDCELSFDHQSIKASFMIKTAEAQINTFIGDYGKTQNFHNKKTLEQAVRVLNCQIKMLREMSTFRKKKIHTQITRWTNFNVMKTIDRWRLYFRWADTIADMIKQKIPSLQKSMKKAIDAYEESRMIVDLELLKGSRVIGMTTSGAARLRKLLQSLGPPIVIVEEAAEVLEAHIVTSLTKDCQHLILIGDHQQLRPSISNLKLVRRYNTNVSLFERMITNGIHSRRLGVQHRMRPEIAALISPHIYPDLQNHPSVRDFPDVLGITTNLFFFTHEFQEEEVDDSSSRTNHREADLTIALANYLIQQGYNPEDVTILTTYKGQMFYLRKQREKYCLLSDIKITVVDNFQGEESKIILLSLVRNNLDNNVGFLKTENRICVALSRAKEGLYMFGNIETLKSNAELWKAIAETLEVNGNLGTTLTLRCENHPETTATIAVAEDFLKLPEGGCGVDCNFQRPCGHKCPRSCHVYDKEHTKIKCLENCEKYCDVGHKCPLKCGDPCQKCKVIVEKQLPCGHMKGVDCSLDPTDSKIMCNVEVDVILPDCGHKATKHCYVPLNEVLCSENCMNRVDPCGHRCGRKCHVNHDPDHEKYVCYKPCAKANEHCRAGLVGDRGEHQCKKLCFETCDPCRVHVVKTRTSCGHMQKIECFEDIDTIPCKANCTRILDCKHKCLKKCGEECGSCMKKVIKVIPDCKHEAAVECSMEASQQHCKEKCEKVMSCGHKCTNRSSQACVPEKCFEILQEKHLAPCGHQVNLPCNIYNSMTKDSDFKTEILMKYCTKPCMEKLACDHLCGGSCGACRQGRLHVPCSQICNQTNICGHQCTEPCNQMCPPCNKPCEIKCSCGVRCNQRCGAPCSPCAERCTRRCRHGGACKRRCGEPCSRAPCDKPCPLKLPCGHRCRGLCGEPCPDICKLCRPDDFPTDFLGGEYGEKEKFVKLADCGHIIELDDLDSWVNRDPEQVKLPYCPKCRKPIVNTYRYKDLINKMFKEEINPIKKRVFGTVKKIAAQKKVLFVELSKKGLTYRVVAMNDNQLWKKAFEVLRMVVNWSKTKKVTLTQLEMQLQYLNILDMIGKCYQSYKEQKLTYLNNEFIDIVNMLCSILYQNVEKISQQQQKDIGNEIKRLNSITQFSKILNNSLYTTTIDLSKEDKRFPPEVLEAIKSAKESVLTWKRYDEDDALKSLQKLQEAVKVSGIATKLERALVVKAIGLKAGSWHKCENGHFYCIGECGGASQVSRCIECKAVVGGTNHKLAAGNSHAPEMDGSRFAAWSEEYNNMANFNLD